MKGVQHITRFKNQLHESYEDIEQQLFASNPKLSTSQIQTQLLLAFALDRIAGCPREEITTHITDGQYDEGIDAFYFNRGEKKVYVFQSKFIETPRHDPISETDSRSFIWGIHQLVRCTPDFSWKNDALNYLKEEIYEALITDNVSFIPCLLSTSDNKVRDEPNTILNEGIKENLGDETELSYYNLSKLYELSSQYSGNNGVNIQIVLNGSQHVSDPYPAYYGWITGDTLSSLYKQHNQRLFSRNLRSGLGQTEVNQEIQNTIIENPDRFWYFNNGVTIVANTIRRKMLHGHNSDVTELTLTDASIINGAQTTTTLGSLPSNEITGSSHFGVWGWCWHGVGACPMIEVATLQTLGGPDMGNGTFSALDMTTYCGLVELGLVAVGMRCQEGGFVLKCRAVNPARLCPGCGRPGDALGSRTRRLAHEPRGHQPTMLVVYVGRYRCRACSRSWCDDISQAAPPRAKLSFGALRWGLVCLIADNMSINRIAAHLAVAWHTANEAILAYGEELLLADSTRFEGVRVIGVDEHVWRHRGGDRYATVIVDLTPVRDHTGPARLLDVVQGRSKHVLSSWLAACPQEWKDNIEIVAMDGFSGYKSAAASQLPGAVTVMDPFHVVHIAIDALEQCRQRVQQETLGHRGRKGDPLYAARKTLLTGTDILTDTSQARLDALFACPDHADVHATWRIYQDLLAAYRDRDPRRGKNTLRQLITTLTRPGLPHTCIELARMGRTFTRRAGDILAYFDHPHTSNGPTEAINGRLEHLRGIAQGFVNHRNYRLRCLLHSGGFQHLLHP